MDDSNTTTIKYNTQRETMPIRDYGRNVYSLIEHAKGIEDRAYRNRMAEYIVEVMAQMNPRVREGGDYKRKLWNHLMVMAQGQLDVDPPYPIDVKSGEAERPQQLDYNQGPCMFRHYGKLMERMVEAVSKMQEGEERTVLQDQIMHQMKRDYIIWNSDSVDDSVIVNQMSQMSHNEIQPAADTSIVLAPLANGYADDNDRKNRKGKKKK